jgi:hypothetical protein
LEYRIGTGHAWCCQKACERCNSSKKAKFWKNKIHSSYMLLKHQTTTFGFQGFLRLAQFQTTTFGFQGIFEVSTILIENENSS